MNVSSASTCSKTPAADGSKTPDADDLRKRKESGIGSPKGSQRGSHTEPRQQQIDRQPSFGEVHETNREKPSKA